MLKTFSARINIPLIKSSMNVFAARPIARPPIPAVATSPFASIPKILIVAKNQIISINVFVSDSIREISV